MVPANMATDPAATQRRICSAAVQLFAQHGFSRTSLRQITSTAGVNLAAVNYHFRAKEELYRYVLLDHLKAINSERITLLNQAEQLAGEQPVPVRAIVETLVRPLMRRVAAPTPQGTPVVRLVARELLESQPFLQKELAQEFDSIMQRYTRALGQSLPGLPASEIHLRMQFTLGALLSAAAFPPDPKRLSTDLNRADECDEFIRRLVDFCAAGLGAPAGAA